MRLFRDRCMVTDSYAASPGKGPFGGRCRPGRLASAARRFHKTERGIRPPCNPMKGAERNFSRESQVARLKIHRMTQHVLLVDDDPVVRDLVREYLQGHGLAVSVMHDGTGLKRRLDAERPSIVVLDVMMPGQDGISALRELRASGDDIPVIFLTARSDVIDRVIGLELGADDYLAKPFDPRELLARIRALLRRQDKLRTQVASELRFDGWRLLPDQRRLFAPDGAELVLSRGEFSLLLALAERPGRVLGREQLLQLSRGEASDSVDRAIDLAISRLR